MNDLSGKGSIHTAHGIMLQEVDATVNKTSREAPIITRDKKMSLESQLPTELDECYILQRKSPVLQIKRAAVPGSDDAF